MKINMEFLRTAYDAATGEVQTEFMRQLAGSGLNPAGDELLTATESCKLLKISRSTLWRHFKPALKIGALPRWKKGELLTGKGGTP